MLRGVTFMLALLLCVVAVGAAAAATRIVPKAGLYAAQPTSAAAAGRTVFYLNVNKKQRIWFMR